MPASKEIKVKPHVAVVTAPPTTPSSSIGENPTLDYLESYLEVKEPRLKYPTLQKRGLIYANNLPKSTINQIIEVLEKTGWRSSDFNRLTIETYFYMGRVGLFQLYTEAKARNAFESDKIEDLIWLRDSLKRILPGVMNNTGQIIKSFKGSGEKEK